ncbi:MAG: MBL fold metallo-hydrolase [Calditrichota bacterium]
MYSLGPYRLDLISDGFFEDDADTFVRECAEKQHPPGLKVRSKPRIRVGFNGLLVRGNGRTVVIDPGTGDKPRHDLVRLYRMEWPRRFMSSLGGLGVSPNDVDTVILTHLHWDHCGAGTRASDNGTIVPTFPNARYFAHRQELDAARSGAEGYISDDFEPLLKTGHLEVFEQDGEIIPDFEIRWTGGHSAGHSIVIIGTPPHPQAVFLSDLVPTSAQLPLECGLSYDVNPVELRRAKERILKEAAAGQYLLMFVHAPKVRAGLISETDRTRYKLESISI